MLVCVLMRLAGSPICDLGEAWNPRTAFLRWVSRIINRPGDFH